jgi:hypothetical protein
MYDNLLFKRLNESRNVVRTFVFQLSQILDPVRSGQVILLRTISQSVSPSWPRAPNYDSWPYFSLEENFGIIFRGASTLTRGRGCHVQGSQSLSVSCIYLYSGVYVYPVFISIIIVIIIIIIIIIIYKRAVIAQSV